MLLVASFSYPETIVFSVTFVSFLTGFQEKLISSSPASTFASASALPSKSFSNVQLSRFSGARGFPSAPLRANPENDTASRNNFCVFRHSLQTSASFPLPSSDRPWMSTSGFPSVLLLRKEVIQPHLPIRLPCYDFTPVIDLTLGCWLLAVTSQLSGAINSHGVTGGVYKARERIHRGMLIRDY